MTRFLLSLIVVAAAGGPALAQALPPVLRIIAIGGHNVGDIPYIDIGVRIGESPQSEDRTLTLTVAETKNIIKGLEDNIPAEFSGEEN